MKHTIQALVENKFGVLARIASLFSARGYNIESLAVGETQDDGVSCMTIVVDAKDEAILEQIKKQLNKLIDVITVVDLTRKGYVDRELFLLKIAKNGEKKQDLDEIVKKFSLKIIDELEDCYIVELCVAQNVKQDLFKMLEKFGIIELIRTGKIAIGK